MTHAQQSDAKARAVEWAQRGAALARESRYADAIAAYRKAAALDAALPGLQLNLGLACFKSGQFSAAAAAFETVLRQTPDSFQARTLLGMSLFGERHFDRAAVQLELALKQQPANTQLLRLLAQSYLWSSQNDRARETFRKLVEVDPDSAATHMLMAQAADAAGHEADAIQEMEAAARVDPKQPDVHFGLGYLYWKQKRYDQAAEQFLQELALNPRHAQAAGYLGDVERQRGNMAEAKRLLDLALSQSTTVRVAWFDRGVIHAAEGERELAVKAFERAVELDPERGDAHYRLGVLYRELGRAREAAEQFAIVKRLHEQRNEDALHKVSGPPKP